MIEITPLAHNDIEKTKIYLLEEFGKSTAQRIIGAIYDDLDKLAVFPQIGVDIFARYGIKTDYLCLITHKNYAFYRIEGDIVRVIRVLDERCDFMKILFGLTTTATETEEYWDE